MDRQRTGFENQQSNEAEQMAPKQTGNLGLDGWASEFVTGHITAASTTRRCERKEQHEKCVSDERPHLWSVGLTYQQNHEKHAADCHAEKDR